jgi:hypothetical protein
VNNHPLRPFEESHLKLFHTLLLLLLTLSVSMLLDAQSTNATLSGVVVDSAGKVIPDAKIEMLNEATDVHYAGQTNGTGIYTVSILPPGQYRVQVSKDGFKTIIKPGIILNVQSALALNFTLPIGATSETVTVDSGTSSINTMDASVSTVIDRNFVENIPLNGRSFQDLISLTPGVVTQSPQTSNSQGIGISGDFSVNGQRTESNYYTVDGVSANSSAGNGNGGPNAATSGSVAASTALGTTQSLVSVDALEEFRVESSTYSAEYGHSPGGQFSFVTRSGTNAFHGTAYNYLRNSFFDANNWFNDYYGTPEPALRQNDFGGTLGGPLFIPRVFDGKDRTFFFASYEGLRLALPQAASVQYVPDTYLREQAPASLKSILNAFPLENGIDYGTTSAPSLAQFIQSYSSPSQVDSTSIRIDETVSPRLTLFFRYGVTPSSTSTRSLSSTTASNIGNHTYTGGVTNLIKEHFTNQLRLGYTDSESSSVTGLDSFGGAVPVSLTDEFGIGGSTQAEPIFYMYYPGVGSSSLATGISKNIGHQWNITDTVDSSFGHHHLRFGLDFRRIVAPLIPNSPLAEAFYESAQSVLTNSADIMVVSSSVSAEPVFNQTALFLQDEWHLSKAVNLSMGLRWELDPAPTESHGNDAYTLRGDVAQPATLELAPRGTSLWNTSWYNFAPRIGGAWKVHDKAGSETILRAGVGVFFDSNNQEASLAFEGIGFTGTGIYFSSPLPVSAAQLNVPTAPVAPYTSSIVYAFPEHLQLPYTLQWNVSGQQAFGTAQVLTVSYVGANGRRLQGTQSLSVTALNPNFGTIEYFDSSITSSYNALQVQFQRSVAKGLGVLAAYTWSHSLDFGSNYSALPLTRGNSDFDLRNNFSAGVSWELPKVRAAKLGSAFLNGWGVDARFTARSAFPVTLRGAYLTDVSTGSSYYGNVNLVPGQPIYLHGSQYPGSRRINPSAFTVPQGNSAGNAGRNFVRGFGDAQANIAARRSFAVHGSLRLQFRAEAFNILNHPNFGFIDSTLTDTLFGESTQMLNQSLGTIAPQYQQGGPRSMQFALKLQF